MGSFVAVRDREIGEGRFAIERKGKYLGVWLGPEAGLDQLSPQIHRYSDRALGIAGHQAALNQSVAAYNTICSSMFSYIFQFVDILQSLIDLEKSRLMKVMHVPPNTWGRAELLAPTVWIGRTPHCLEATAFASSISLAIYDREYWVDIWEAFCLIARHHLSQDCISRGEWRPRWWSVDPILGLFRRRLDSVVGQQVLDDYEWMPGKLHSRAFERARAALHLPRWCALFGRRIVQNGFAFTPEHVVKFEAARKCVCVCVSMYWWTCFVKSVSGAWHTDARLGVRPAGPCLSGVFLLPVWMI